VPAQAAEEEAPEATPYLPEAHAVQAEVPVVSEL
jgi:hypothetical protein